MIHCDLAERARAFHLVTEPLFHRLAGPSGSEIATLVLEREPVLGAFTPLVKVLCERSWKIRRPRDLAVACCKTIRELKQELATIGFTRIEHFITYVRTVALEQLAAQRHVPLPNARRFAGIADPSNLRRQLERVQRGSPGALRKLNTLVRSLALLLPLLSGVGCQREAGKQSGQGVAAAATPAGDSAIALPVVGAPVRRGDLILTVRTTGQVRAERQVSLRAEAHGTVEAILARPGERVDSGAVLVRLDPRPFDLAVREAEAGYADAQVRYHDIMIGEDTLNADPTAVERRKNARLRAGIDAAEARLERAKLDREQATIRAPFGGTVDQVPAVVGQHVSSGDAIATVVDLGSLLVEAAVPEHDLPLIRRGAAATVSLAAAGLQAYPGRVLAVLPLVDTTTRAGRALVRVRTGDGMLRPGMYADVELEATRLPDRVIVPASAVIERDGRPLVFRYHGGRAEWVYVAPGRSNGRETEILPDSVTRRPAVVPGDTVLVEGHLTLTHDAPVRLITGRDIGGTR